MDHQSDALLAATADTARALLATGAVPLDHPAHETLPLNQPTVDMLPAMPDFQGRAHRTPGRVPAGPLELAALPEIALLSADQPDADLEPIGQLGQGGMGIVELAVQRSLRRAVAIKRVRTDDPSKVADRAAGLLHEAIVTGALQHPNIVPVYLLGCDEHGLPVFAMKRVEGVAWSELISDAHHPAWARLASNRLRWHVELLRQLCHAVEYAHCRGVVHRDIKPDNVMIGEFGEVYLLDWGVALQLNDAATAAASLQQVVGTPAYMAPELASSLLGPVTRRTDVYLLGACLYAVLTGRPPHCGANMYEVLVSALNGEYVAPQAAPPELAAVCAKAMAADPAQRYASASELQTALADFVLHAASQHLCDVAEGRLEQLRSAVSGVHDPVHVQRLAQECRFAFEQALGEWPANARAQQGLQQALHVLLRHELDQRNVSAAMALLASMDQPPAGAEAELAHLQLALQRQQHAEEQLDAIERDFDPATGRAQRRQIFAAIGVALILLAVFVIPAQLLGVRFAEAHFYLPATAGPLLFLLGGSVAAWFWRERLLATRVNQMLAAAAAVFLVALSANRFAGMVLGQPFEVIFVRDALLAGVVATLSGLVVGRVFYITAVMFGAAYVAALFSPTFGPAIFMASVVCSVLLVLLTRSQAVKKWLSR